MCTLNLTLQNTIYQGITIIITKKYFKIGECVCYDFK